VGSKKTYKANSSIRRITNHLPTRPCAAPVPYMMPIRSIEADTTAPPLMMIVRRLSRSTRSVPHSVANTSSKPVTPLAISADDEPDRPAWANSVGA